jgi:cytochrome P450
MVEMARWLFERDGIPYAEEAHAPLLHLLATRRVGGGNEVPVIVTAEGVWAGARAVLVALDAKSRPGQRLLGETEDESAKTLAMVDQMLALLQQQVRRYAYFHLLPQKSLAHAVATADAPWWERVLVQVFYPQWQKLMGKALDFSEDLIEAAPRDIERAFDLVEQALPEGQNFLSGDHPGTLDIVFAALVAPVVLPANFGAVLPALEQLPAEMRAFVVKCRSRRAGRLALAAYAEARGQSQPRMPWPRRFSLGALLFGPKVQLAAARLVLRVAPRVVLGRLAVFSRWADVQEILSRDLDFLIEPINKTRIDELNGPFVLGMDRGKDLPRERRQMYTALASVNFSAIQEQVHAEAQRLLSAAAKAGGRIDVVNGYARLVAARTAVLLFGVRGPSEAALTASARASFEHLFLNLSDDEKIRTHALAAAEPLKQWLSDEIEQVSSKKKPGVGLIGALLARRDASDPDALDDEGVRRTVSGLLIGSIDTTATTVGHIMKVLLEDQELLARVREDLDDPVRLRGWCWEALRFWPHNPILLRKARAGTQIGGKTLKRDATVYAVSLSAMQDPSAFPDPGKLDPGRSMDRYLHFGGGLHPCAGRAVNAIQIPELIRQLIVFGAAEPSTPQFEGPFLDQLVVRLTKNTETAL